jgi:hypothetical protein
MFSAPVWMVVMVVVVKLVVVETAEQWSTKNPVIYNMPEAS